MKKQVLSLVLASSLVLGAATMPVSAATRGGYFTDVATEEINRAAELKLIRGDGSGQFRPGDAITRAEWATMVYNGFCLAKVPAEIDQGQLWWEPAAAWVFTRTFSGYQGCNGPTATGVTLADVFYMDGEFNPDAPASSSFVLAVAFAAIHPGERIEDLDALCANPAEWAQAHGLDCAVLQELGSSQPSITREASVALLLYLYDSAAALHVPTA